MTQSLLKIDVDREIRKLTQNRFKSSTEWAVALCRYAMGRGCTALSLRLEARRLVFRFRGTPVEWADLNRLSIIFDEQQLPDSRHRAIVELEDGASFDLLCAFYLKKARVNISCHAGQLTIAPRKRPLLRHETGNAETIITVQSSKLKRAATEKALYTACRFSPIPVVLNHKRISSGHRLENCFAQRNIEWPGVSGVVGIPLESDFVRQVTLKNGITVRDSLRQPAFGLLYHAVIDSPKSAKIDQVRDVVREMYKSLGKYIEEMDAPTRRRALEVLFIRYQETQDIRYVQGVHAFERVDGKRFTVEALQRMAQAMPLYGVRLEESDAPWNLVGRQTFYLDARQWNFLEKELGIHITVPPLLLKNGNWKISSASNGNGKSGVKPFSKEIRAAAEQLFSRHF